MVCEIQLSSSALVIMLSAPLGCAATTLLRLNILKFHGTAEGRSRGMHLGVPVCCASHFTNLALGRRQRLVRLELKHTAALLYLSYLSGKPEQQTRTILH